MKLMRKYMSVILSAAMLMSMASCSQKTTTKKEKNKDEVSDKDIVKIADDFSSNVVEGDSKKIYKLSTSEWEDGDDEIEAILDYSSDKDEDHVEVLEKISESFEYEVDDDSVEVKKKKASVDVTFTLLDYSSIEIDGAWGSIDEVLQALDDADTVDVEVTIELELEDDNWVVSNPDEVVKEVYKFVNVDFIVDQLTFEDFYKGYDCIQNLNDASALEVSLKVDSSIEEKTNINKDVYYVVYRDGSMLLASKDLYYGEKISYSANNGANVNDKGYLVEGFYEIQIFAADNDNILDTIGIVVTESPSSTQGTTIEGLPEGKVYAAEVDFTKSFVGGMQEAGLEGEIVVESPLIVHLYLVLCDDGTSHLMMLGSDFNIAIKTFVHENLDALCMAIAGVDFATFSKTTGLTAEEFESEFAELMDSQADFDATLLEETGIYKIDGNSLYVSFGMSVYTGTINGDTIILIVPDEGLSDYGIGSLLEFELV